MTVMELNQLKKSIGSRELLHIAHLQVQDGQRIGLVGKNGEGKTTLLRVLNGEEMPDEGTVSVQGTSALLPQLKRTDTVKSGGEITAEYITEAIEAQPKLLLADEPTTNLDTSHVEWVEKELKRFNGALIVVSHDRQLLDAVCDTIWELESGNITVYTGNYSQYIEQKQRERQHQQTEYEKYKYKERQLTNALEQKKQKAVKATKAPKKVSPSEARITGAKPYFAKKQKKLNQGAKAIQTRLEKLEEVEKPKDHAPVKMDLPNERAFKDKIILRVEGLEGKIGDKRLWKPATFFVKGGDKIGIIGPNGSGKTTLLKRILEADEAGVYRSPAMKIGYFAQNLSVLNPEKTILKNVSQDSHQSETLIRTVLARLHFYQEDVHKPVSVLSGGERVKVSLAKLFVSDSNTLVLDEPTNYLDVYALEALEDLLREYEGTVLFVSHDRRFVSAIATRILSLEEGELTLFDGDYEAFQTRDQKKERDTTEDRLLMVETAIADVLSRLSLNPTEELDKEFQRLLKEKQALQSN